MFISFKMVSKELIFYSDAVKVIPLKKKEWKS